jgi:Flp pilus assembly protein TadD
MSKMMDNLARVRNEEPEKKPSLFIVREQAPLTAMAPPPRRARGKVAAVWAAVAVALASVGFLFLQTLPSTEKLAERANAPAPDEAVALLRANNFAGARQKLDELLKIQPGNRAHQINRAYALQALGQSAAAEREYLRLLKQNPADSIVQNNLGALYLRVGRADEAEVLLRKAYDAGHADARLNLASALERRKDWAGALAIFEGILAAEDSGAARTQIKERVRRLRSLAVSSTSRKEGQ